MLSGQDNLAIGVFKSNQKERVKKYKRIIWVHFWEKFSYIKKMLQVNYLKEMISVSVSFKHVHLLGFVLFYYHLKVSRTADISFSE